MKVYFKYTLPQNVKEEWNEFWNNSAHAHPQHHLLYGEVERAKGNVPVYVYGMKKYEKTRLEQSSEMNNS